MTDETTTETTTTETPEPSTVTASELEDIIGRVVDSRLENLDLDGKLSKLDVLDGLSGSIDEAFARNKTAGGSTDNKGLLRDIEALVDRKLSGIGNGNVTVRRKPGWLGRYLTGSSSGD